MGTVLYVLSDNVGAHSFVNCRSHLMLINFVGSVCPLQSGSFSLRAKESYNVSVSKLRQNVKMQSADGVKNKCVFSRLSYFHCIMYFWHDVLEGIVPLELWLCLKNVIRKKYFTFTYLIKWFTSKVSDKTNCPRKISISNTCMWNCWGQWAWKLGLTSFSWNTTLIWSAALAHLLTFGQYV